MDRLRKDNTNETYKTYMSTLFYCNAPFLGAYDIVKEKKVQFV